MEINHPKYMFKLRTEDGLKELSDNIQYLQKGIRFRWSETFAKEIDGYGEGSIVSDEEGVFYYSLINRNFNNPKESNTWQSFRDFRSHDKDLGDNNLNNYKGDKEGIWYQESDTKAIENNSYPIKRGGTLVVYKNTVNNNGCIQIYYPYKDELTGNVPVVFYYRHYKDDGWTLWYMVKDHENRLNEIDNTIIILDKKVDDNKAELDNTIKVLDKKVDDNHKEINDKVDANKVETDNKIDTLDKKVDDNKKETDGRLDGHDQDFIDGKIWVNGQLVQLKNEIKPYLMPVGGILAWPSSNIPSGFLLCNGQSFNKTLCPELAKICPSGTVPDLRGVFLRGLDNGRGLDNDRGLLSYQQDAMVDWFSNSGSIILREGNEGAYASGIFKYTKTGDRGYQGGGSGSYGKVTLSLSNAGINVANENRPKNIAVNYIIKSDLADSVNNDTPTAINVSPTSYTGPIGNSFKISSTVIPTSLASQYPVSYTSNNTSVCTVDSSGNVTLKGGGSTTVLCSISSGLTNSIAVTCNVNLNSISINPVGVVTDTGTQLSTSASPSNHTENLIWEVSDTNIAYITDEGMLYALADGSVTVVVKGSLSGVSGSRIVQLEYNVNNNTEGYLTSSNNLSDVGNVSESRSNLNVYSKPEVDDLLKNNSGNNSWIAVIKNGKLIRSDLEEYLSKNINSLPVSICAVGGWHYTTGNPETWVEEANDIYVGGVKMGNNYGGIMYPGQSINAGTYQYGEALTGQYKNYEDFYILFNN